MNNIYMGLDSAARIPPYHNKIDTDREILLKCFAVGYDAHNNIMLNPRGAKPSKTSEKKIHARFADLKRLARKHAPHKLRTIEALERLSIDNFRGKINDLAYIHRIRLVAMRHGVNTFALDQAEAKINAAEGMRAATVLRMKRPVQPKRLPIIDIFKRSGEMFKKAKREPLFKPPKTRQRRVSQIKMQPTKPDRLIKRMFGVK
jgi:hypothetical protein